MGSGFTPVAERPTRLAAALALGCVVFGSSSCSLLTGFSDLAFDRADTGVRDLGSNDATPPADVGPTDAALDGGLPPLDGSGDAGMRCLDDDALDCDGDGVCETDGATDRESCGACRTTCDASSGCYDGVCDAIVEVALASAGHHACARLGSGRVVCWGSNAYGQLGDGTFADRGRPVAADNLPGLATSIAAGSTSTCAVVGGAVWCWGLGANGELGSLDVAVRTRPSEPVPGLTDAERIAGGAGHYCAVRTNGRVVCWGRNDHAQLGDGTTASRATPVPVPNLGEISVVVAGYAHTCGQHVDGHVSCWGHNDLAQTGIVGGADPTFAPTEVPAVDSTIHLSAGAAHTCAVRSDGKVRCWGNGGLDQLGRDGRPVAGAAEEVTGLREAATVAAGRDFTCASIAGGTVSCWGQSAEGQLGDPARADPSALPVPVPGLVNVKALFSGDRTVCATLEDAGIVCWGADDVGLLGRGRTTAQPVAARVVGLAGVRTLDVGLEHVCALGASRVVTCWGANSGFQLGDGTDHGSSAPRPTAPAATDYRAISAGGAHTCGLRETGVIDCWGTNDQLQLGVPSPAAALAPSVTPVLGDRVESMGSGYFHVCARMAGDALQCWGANRGGQLGRGAILRSELPAVVAGQAATGSIDGSDSNTCFVSAGAVRCMGDNALGQIGDGTNEPRTTPVVVSGIDDAQMVATGQGFACALHTSGAVSCWGRNDGGQLGIGETGAALPTPNDVVGVSGAIGVTAGSGHACAWLADGRALCWGSNVHGQLGDGTLEGRPTPVEVTALAAVELLGAGRDTTCALAAGEVFCWGERAWGKLGDGTPLFDAHAAPIAGSP